MSYVPPNVNGQATKANSTPVVIASDQDSLVTKSAYSEISLSLGPTPTAGQLLLPATDVSGYKFFSVQVAGTWTGSYTFEGSNDGITWYQHPASGFATNSGTISNFTVNGMWRSGVFSKYLRIRCSVSGTGTTTGILAFWTIPPPDPIAQVAAVLSGTGTVAPVPLSSASALNMYNNTALTNTPILIKAGASRLIEWDFYNPNNVNVWVQVFNVAAAASVTLGSTAPTRSIFIPSLSGRDFGNIYSGNYGSGIVVACATTNTGGVAPTLPIQAYIGYV
jgi:hypothetical protein